MGGGGWRVLGFSVQSSGFRGCFMASGLSRRASVFRAQELEFTLSDYRATCWENLGLGFRLRCSEFPVAEKRSDRLGARLKQCAGACQPRSIRSS